MIDAAKTLADKVRRGNLAGQKERDEVADMLILLSERSDRYGTHLWAEHACSCKGVFY
jgi:hypothetical protein